MPSIPPTFPHLTVPLSEAPQSCIDSFHSYFLTLCELLSSLSTSWMTRSLQIFIWFVIQRTLAMVRVVWRFPAKSSCFSGGVSHFFRPSAIQSCCKAAENCRLFGQTEQSFIYQVRFNALRLLPFFLREHWIRYECRWNVQRQFNRDSERALGALRSRVQRQRSHSTGLWGALVPFNPEIIPQIAAFRFFSWFGLANFIRTSCGQLGPACASKDSKQSWSFGLWWIVLIWYFRIFTTSLNCIFVDLLMYL